jgi:LysM repeat protein
MLHFRALMMKLFTIITFLLIPLSITNAQVSNETRTAEVARAQEMVNRVLLDAGVYFKDGLIAYQEDKRYLAGEKFNKSVEVFLYSALNIQREQKLQGCYNQLLETIYRIEFPAENQLPKIKDLALTCNWNIEAALADNVAVLVEKSSRKLMAPTNTMATAEKVGFGELEFEPSPLDELSKLELVPVDDPPSPIRIVKAKAGDTVAKLAQRNNQNAGEVARLNGLSPNSVLGAGRPIKLPSPFQQPTIVRTHPDRKLFDTSTNRGENQRTRVGAPCSLSVKYAPTIRGLKVGMDKSQVVGILGSSGLRIVPLMSSLTESILIYLPTLNAHLKGIESLQLKFFRDSLYEISINYEKAGIEWRDGYEYSLILAEKLKLPQNAWSSYGMGANIKCKGFSLGALADRNGSSYLRLTHDALAAASKAAANQALIDAENRKREEELKKKRVFNP